MTVRVLALHLTIDDLLDDLRITGRVLFVDQISRRNAAHRLRSEIAVAVIDDTNRSSVSTLDSILEVVDEAVTVRGSGVAVGVVDVARQTIIRIVVRGG